MASEKIESEDTAYLEVSAVEEKQSRGETTEMSSLLSQTESEVELRPLTQTFSGATSMSQLSVESPSIPFFMPIAASTPSPAQPKITTSIIEQQELQLKKLKELKRKQDEDERQAKKRRAITVQLYEDSEFPTKHYNVDDQVYVEATIEAKHRIMTVSMTHHIIQASNAYNVLVSLQDEMNNAAQTSKQTEQKSRKTKSHAPFRLLSINVDWNKNRKRLSTSPRIPSKKRVTFT